MLGLITACYFAILPGATLIFHTFMNGLTRHGHISTGISKNNYMYFYAYGLLLSAFLSLRSVYSIHLGRRLIETQVFRYSKRSKMNPLQFVHGIVYYTFMCLHLRDKCIRHGGAFILLNIIQSISHYYVFTKKRFIYSHYAAEIMIYLMLFWDVGTIQLFFNLMYVLSFTFSSVRNRRRDSVAKKK